MKKLQSVVFRTVVLLVLPQLTAQQGTYLQAVNVIFRHGDRNPMKSYPGDPYQNASFWPEGWASLTSRGKLRLFHLGKYMRRRYPNFQRKNVEIYTSDTNRTITSAKANLAGFYGLNRSFLKHIDSYKPRGLGIHVVPQENDDFIYNTRPCPRFKQLFEEHALNSKAIQEYNAKHQEALDIINEKTNQTLKFGMDLVYLADTILIEHSRDLQLSPWANKLYESGVFQDFRNHAFEVLTATNEMKKIRAGPLIEKLLEQFDQVIEAGENTNKKYPSPNITIISGHDSTLANLFSVLNLDFYKSGIPYGAAIFTELHRLNFPNDEDKKYIIKMFYKNDSDKDPMSVNIPQCPHPCRYETFTELLRPFFMDNFGQTCQLRSNPKPILITSKKNPKADVEYFGQTSSSLGAPIAKNPETETIRGSNSNLEDNSSSGSAVSEISLTFSCCIMLFVMDCAIHLSSFGV